MVSSDSSETENFEVKFRKQRFRSSWLADDVFKGWLEPVKGDEYKSKCKACGKLLSCGSSELKKHAATKLHMKNVAAIKKSSNIQAFFNKQAITVDEDVANFEIRMSMFFAEHNVGIQVVEHLIPLLKVIVPDSTIIKNCQLGRTKCTKVISNVLASVELEQLVEKLKTTKFSVLVDESTDVANKKTMCLLVRYFDEQREETIVQLLDLLHVGTDCTADALYNTFKTCILGYGIPYDNVIGLCCDGPNVMVGQHNSFSSKLIADPPDVITIKCICHSAAIIANKACLQLPRAPEELIRQIGTYVSASSKRCGQLEQFQEMLNEEKRKILRTSDTRWLSRQKCVKRILENWHVLEKYFKFTSSQDKLKGADLILADIKNECNKAYMFFLKYVLNYFSILNALFQAKKPLVHALHSESTKIFYKLGQNFIKKSELEFNCAVRSPHITLPIENIYVGPECEELLKTFPPSEAYQVKSDCLKFYITALEEMQRRLPLKHDSIFKEMEFLNPESAIGGGDKSVFQFKLLCQKFAINVDHLTQEWLTMEYNFSQQEKISLSKLDVEKFWSTICKSKNFNDNLLFPNLSKLIKILLSMPHANADAERIFQLLLMFEQRKGTK